jgi:transcriptional regulator with GAF, ATPase, and Fis domain
MEWESNYQRPDSEIAISNARAFDEINRLRSALQRERDHLREEVHEALSFSEIIGGSAALRAVLEQVALVAPTDATVLILCESGTGKELIASALHERSLRRQGPLVRVNCGSIPAELFESEFFGHARGSFTVALRDRDGRFQ